MIQKTWTSLIILVFSFLLMLISCNKNTVSREEMMEGHKKLLEIKNNLTKDDLLNCNIETWQCSIDIKEIDMIELAELLKDTVPIYPIYRKLPYASLSFKQTDELNYFLIDINIYNELNINGVAVLDIYLYKNGKTVAYQYYSSPELTEWGLKLLPDVFNKIQEDNLKHFYYQEEK